MARGGSITTRLIALLTFCAALIIGVGMLVDYRLSQDQLLERLQQESEATIRATVIDLENWLDGVESSTLFLARVLQQRDYSKQELEQLLRDVVENNADIFGAAIALAPTLAGTELGFAPYYYRRDGDLGYADLADAEHNYQQQAWYTATVAAAAPLWVEPYYDEGGGNVLMTTFAVPVYRVDAAGKNVLYAVVTADVTLAELHAYLQRLRLGGSGFGILLSRNGLILSGANPANVMRHFADTTADKPDQAPWQDMFNAALAGEVASRHIACDDMPGQCVIRLGALASTGWPVGVVYSEDEMLAPLRAFQLKSASIGLLTLLLMALAVIIVTRRLTRPLAALARASRHIARGDLDAALPAARGRDEVASLVNSFAAMQRDLKTYIAELETATARRGRLEGELGAARDIQMAMLPHAGQATELDPRYALWARVRPARSVGGDLYSYLRRDNSLFIAVGDVSDKGVPAALFMARAISLIQQLAAVTSAPECAMATLNNALASGNDNCMFVTLFLGLLDLDSGELRFASAGHTAPSLVRQGTVCAIEQSQGPALGLAAELEFAASSLWLQAGDRLAIFTDGIDEAFNPRDEMFGIERWHKALSSSCPLPVAEAGPALFRSIDEFAGDTPQSDDITLLLLELGNAATQGDRVRLTRDFAPGPQLTANVQAWLRQALQPLAVAQDSLADLLLVAEEVVTNVAKYADLPTGASMSIALSADPHSIELEVRDSGIAFDPLREASRATLGGDIENAAIGGLGVHLISALTDGQNYRREDGYNILRLTKLLASQPV